MKIGKAKVFLSMGVALLLLSGPLDAEFYEWEDKQGNTHFTDDLSKIPPESRKKAKDDGEAWEKKGTSNLTIMPNSQGSQKNPYSQSKKTHSTSSSRKKTKREVDDNGNSQSYWYNRMQGAKSRLEQTESRLNLYKADKRKGYSSSYRLSQIPILEKKVKDLRYQVEMVIPGEARRAGAPPGWLRD